MSRERREELEEYGIAQLYRSKIKDLSKLNLLSAQSLCEDDANLYGDLPF